MIHSTIHVRYLRDDATATSDARTVAITPASGGLPVVLPLVQIGSADPGIIELTHNPSAFTPGDDPVELSPVLRGAAESGAVQLTATPSAWQRGKWCAAFFLVGLALGAVIVAVVNYLIP